MYLHTKYGTATINNIGNLLWVHFFKAWLLISRSQWQKTVSDIPWPQHISTNWIWGLICHIIWDMLLTLCFACCRWVVLSVNCFCLHTTVVLTVCYINRQRGRGYHYSDTNACGESAASKNFKGIFCMLSNVSSLQIFFSILFIKIVFLDNISMSNRLDPDQPRRSDLGPNCLRRQN